MKPFITIVVFFILSFMASPSLSTRTDPSAQLKHSKKGSSSESGSGSDNNYGGAGGFLGPGGGFNIPGLGNGVFGGGYGAGYGGPNGGYSKGGVIRPTVVCRDKGPCFQKKVTCPARCFSSFSRSGKGYGGGGGGGGCTVDCKKKCTAYC